MVILFIIVVLGYALCKLGYMGDKFDQKLSSIVIDVTCPALILSSVMGTELPDRSLILPLLGVGFLTYVVLLVFGFWVPRFVSKDRDEQGMIGFALSATIMTKHTDSMTIQYGSSVYMTMHCISSTAPLSTSTLGFISNLTYLCVLTARMMNTMK